MSIEPPPLTSTRSNPLTERVSLIKVRDPSVGKIPQALTSSMTMVNPSVAFKILVFIFFSFDFLNFIRCIDVRRIIMEVSAFNLSVGYSFPEKIG
jgi:hypothetical protein